MATVVVMFNLKEGVSVDDYESWARETDLPTVNGLPSVEDFRVLRATGLLTGPGTPPYAYTELIEVPDVAALGEDVQTETMQRVSAQFQEFAADPVFVVTEGVT